MRHWQDNLSCMFTLPYKPSGDRPHWPMRESERNNHDWQGGHTLPRLELPEPGKLPAEWEQRIAWNAFQALKAAMAVSPKDIATMAKQHRDGITSAAIYARDTALRPDDIPSNTDAIKVHHWEPEKTVSIPLPAKPGKKADFIKVTIPARPVGTVIGTCSTEAWRAGEHSNVRVHQLGHCMGYGPMLPMPTFKAPKRELTASEQQVAAWLAEPGRTVTRQRRSTRLASLMSKFWEKPDTDGIDPRNAELRSATA